MYIAHQRKSDKKEQSVVEHLQAVSELANGFTEIIGLPLSGELIGLLHDLGKYSEEFQEYIRFSIKQDSPDFDVDAEEDLNYKKGKIDHSTAGAQLIKSVEKKHPAFSFL
ncbi:MAG: CRISPR-associated endonuclease Cas3'', partial [Fibrobacterota bacterium]